jgi:starch-binding outer membrane protein, SusD/RagB family
MKNIKFYKFNLALMSGIIFLLTTKCVDLEEHPRDFVSPANFYNNSSQIEAALCSALNRLYSYWHFYSYGLMNFNNDDQIIDGLLVMDDSYGNDVWRGHFKSVADLNPAIEALNEDKLGTSATQQEKNELLAEARFYRAFNYFCLVRLYGPVPLITENTNLITDAIVRTPIVDVYDFIESELLFAIDILPVSWPSEKRGRPSKDAAKSLLAKVYITMATAPLNETSNYLRARDMAKQVMDAGNYSLVPDIDKVFEMENSYGPEMIWSFHATEDDPATDPQIWTPASMADGWGDFKCDKTWAESYPEEPRKHAYLLLEDWDGNPYTSFGWPVATPGIKKFIYLPLDEIKRYRSTENYPILRYADVLLIFAEAENMVNNGPDQAACDAANQIINRANSFVANPADPLLTTSMSKQDFDDAVIQQRNLELCYEYDRWYDLIRKRILYEKTIPQYQQNFSENDYLYPIPQSDLRLNPLLTQNPGYTTPSRN